MIIEKLILFQIMAVCPMREANWLLPLLTYAFFWPFGGGWGVGDLILFMDHFL